MKILMTFFDHSLISVLFLNGLIGCSVSSMLLKELFCRSYFMLAEAAALASIVYAEDVSKKQEVRDFRAAGCAGQYRRCIKVLALPIFVVYTE
jgi:hypothetical protein